MIPAGVIFNKATGRWHPVVFRPAPMPGGSDAGEAFQRYRSAGHHTAGFAAAGEADAYIAERPEWTATGASWEWDGTGIPALTAFFSRDCQKHAASTV